MYMKKNLKRNVLIFIRNFINTIRVFIGIVALASLFPITCISVFFAELVMWIIVLTVFNVIIYFLITKRLNGTIRYMKYF